MSFKDSIFSKGVRAKIRGRKAMVNGILNRVYFINGSRGYANGRLKIKGPSKVVMNRFLRNNPCPF